MQKHKNYDEEAQKKLFDELISHNKLQISDKHEFYDKEGSIIFSVWPGTQTSAFSDLKIA